jgi:hypothetical protein
MSDRRPANMLALKPRTHVPALAPGVKGILVMVDGEVLKDSLPIETEAMQTLLHEVELIATCYSEGGLPPKTFFAKFASSSLMVLFARRSLLIIWMDPTANISEVEKAGRKLVSTAHLKGSHRTETILLPAHPVTNRINGHAVDLDPSSSTTRTNEYAGEFISPSHLTLIKIMSWSEASSALESILTKVLTHAQASRMIERALKDKGVDVRDPFDIHQFKAVGADLLLKIPNRSIRQSLTSEFEALVTRLA